MSTASVISGEFTLIAEQSKGVFVVREHRTAIRAIVENSRLNGCYFISFKCAILQPIPVFSFVIMQCHLTLKIKCCVNNQFQLILSSILGKG